MQHRMSKKANGFAQYMKRKTVNLHPEFCELVAQDAANHIPPSGKPSFGAFVAHVLHVYYQDDPRYPAIIEKIKNNPAYGKKLGRSTQSAERSGLPSVE